MPDSKRQQHLHSVYFKNLSKPLAQNLTPYGVKFSRNAVAKFSLFFAEKTDHSYILLVLITSEKWVKQAHYLPPAAEERISAFGENFCPAAR